MDTMNKALLSADARNRAARTFLQGLALDVLVAAVLVLATAVGEANSWGDLEWSLLGLTLLKTALQTAASYLMRRVLDGSALPTPLPPNPPGEPDDDQPAPPE